MCSVHFAVVFNATCSFFSHVFIAVRSLEACLNILERPQCASAQIGVIWFRYVLEGWKPDLHFHVAKKELLCLQIMHVFRKK